MNIEEVKVYILHEHMNMYVPIDIVCIYAFSYTHANLIVFLSCLGQKISIETRNKHH